MDFTVPQYLCACRLQHLYRMRKIELAERAKRVEENILRWDARPFALIPSLTHISLSLMRFRLCLRSFCFSSLLSPPAVLFPIFSWFFFSFLFSFLSLSLSSFLFLFHIVSSSPSLCACVCHSVCVCPSSGGHALGRRRLPPHLLHPPGLVFCFGHVPPPLPPRLLHPLLRLPLPGFSCVRRSHLLVAPVRFNSVSSLGCHFSFSFLLHLFFSHRAAFLYIVGCGDVMFESGVTKEKGK